MNMQKILDWFHTDRYAPPSLDDEGKAREAALAVLDRVTFYQTVTHPGFDPASVGDDVGETLEALRHWTAEPYRRADGRTLELLRGALQPVPDDEIQAFEDVLDREEEEAQGAAWGQVWEEVRGLPSSERWQKAIEIASQREEPTKPEAPSRVGKLLEYRAAAYLDWALYLALAGEPPTSSAMERMHGHLWDGMAKGPDWRTVKDFLRRLEGTDHLSLRARIEEGGVAAAWCKNVQRRRD